MMLIFFVRSKKTVQSYRRLLAALICILNALHAVVDRRNAIRKWRKRS